NGGDYFALVLDEDRIQLAATAGGAKIGLDLGTTSGLRHGIEIRSTLTQNDLPIGGLASGLVYYAIVDGETSLRLAESPREAVDAEPIMLDASEIPLASTHLLTASENDDSPGIVVRAKLTSKSTQNAGTLIGSEPTLSDFLTKGEVTSSFRGKSSFDPFPKGFKEKYPLTGGDDRVKNSTDWKTGKGELSISGSVAVNLVLHDEVSAIIEGSLTSDTEVTVESLITQKVQTKAQGNVVPNAGKKWAVGVAVPVGVYENSAKAVIADTASIEADEALNVNALVSYPLLVDAVDLIPFSSCIGIDEATDCHPIKDLATLLDGSLGLSRILNTWANTKVFTPKSDNLVKKKDDNTKKLTSFTFSVGVTSYDNESLAEIEDGARINQSEAAKAKTTGQRVSVTAATDMELVA
ncbi:MAG: hypothetical protein ABGY24_00430, partial [bacterium]